MNGAILAFLEGVVQSCGVSRVVRDAAKSKGMIRRPYVLLVPGQESIEKDGTRIGREEVQTSRGWCIRHTIRAWVRKVPVRVSFADGSNSDARGLTFLAALPRGFDAGGVWVELEGGMSAPPLDESLLDELGCRVVEVTARIPVTKIREVPVFRDLRFGTLSTRMPGGG